MMNPQPQIKSDVPATGPHVLFAQIDTAKCFIAGIIGRVGSRTAISGSTPIVLTAQSYD